MEWYIFLDIGGVYMSVAFVTGGSRGIGAETVKLLAQKGWSVAFCYLNDDAAAESVAQSTGALKIKADVADAAAGIHDLVADCLIVLCCHRFSCLSMPLAGGRPA